MKVERKAASGMMLVLLLTSMLTLAFNVFPAKASGTIYIRADGSIDPPTAPIQQEGKVYTFTGNISDYVWVSASNIVIDGAGYTVQGTGTGSGIGLSSVHNVTIKDARIRDFSTGIRIQLSSNNSICSNILTGNAYGILLLNSAENNIFGSNFSQNTISIHGYGPSDKNSIYENTITDDDYGILISGSQTNVSGNNVTVYYEAIRLYSSSNCSISENWCITSAGAHAPPLVSLSDVSNSSVSRNILTNGNFGIRLDGSGKNTIVDNNASSNNYGIYLLSSSDNTIVDNTASNNKDGIFFASSHNNTATNNTVTNSQNNGIYLMSYSHNNILAGNIVLNNNRGIHLWTSSNNSLTGNYASDNEVGIYLVSCMNNTVTGNTASSNNNYAIRLGSAIYNVFYHNNFIADTSPAYAIYSDPNTWDNGYPSGGNHWSDYSGVDLYSGPAQDQPGSDEIGDTPYGITFDNQDSYPLMEPWAPAPPTIMASLDIDPGTLNFRSKGEWITAYIQLPEGYNASDIDATTILLNGTVAPVLDPKYGFVGDPSGYLVDYNNDGILERMVKFDRASIASWIYRSVGMQYRVSSTITGKLADGTPFEGTCIISVVYSGGGSGRHK